MSRHRATPSHYADRPPRRRRLIALRVALAAVAIAAATVALLAPSVVRPETTAAAGALRAPATLPGSVQLDAPDPVLVPVPTAVRVPSIGVSSTLEPLGVDASGALIPPADTAQAGWFAGGPAPGAVGPAVIAGHVDSFQGPGVFFRLGSVVAGDEVDVDRADGSTVRFRVTGVEHYPKDAFPTTRVYGPTTDPELRLITCGGAFDAAERSYVDNVVVYATQV